MFRETLYQVIYITCLQKYYKSYYIYMFTEMLYLK